MDHNRRRLIHFLECSNVVRACATPAALLGLFFHFLGHILGPLTVWLVKRGDSPEIDAHGKESLNFQISMLIYDAIAAILCIFLIGILILIALWVQYSVIIASVKASEGNLSCIW